MARFNGKVALVTGGTSGIGKATALAFAKEGAKVVLSGRRETEGLAVVNEITSTDGTAHFVRADASKEADVKRLVEETVAKFGRLDIAFNNAGTEWLGVFTEVTEADYRRVFDVNVQCVLVSMKHEIPAMLKTGCGAIINASSTVGHIGSARRERVHRHEARGGRTDEGRGSGVRPTKHSRERGRPRRDHDRHDRPVRRR